ncbi:MAG: cation:proton antiporter [Phycisphaerae bacterium]
MNDLIDVYNVSLLIVGLLVLGAVTIPDILRGRPGTYPIICLVLGYLLFLLPLDWPTVDPRQRGTIAEHLAELAVIIALMSAGLKIQRPLGWRSWSCVWRLLGITMPLTIALTALTGWAGGLPIASALLAGAVLAPTDPVLASDVQIRGPHRDGEADVRFTLTAEAGLNDGLAFPFTNLALAALAASSLAAPGWLIDWFLVDVLYKLTVGLVVGLLSGWLLSWLFFTALRDRLVEKMAGSVALAATLVSYGLCEVLHGYGFIGVFVAAQVIRRREREHKYHRALHSFSEICEHLLMFAVLVLFGGALAQGLLTPLRPALALSAVAVVVLIRPLIGWLGLWRSSMESRRRLITAAYGIRGIGSFYYLAFALNEGRFPLSDELWAMISLCVLLSIVFHGLTAGPVMTQVE